MNLNPKRMKVPDGMKSAKIVLRLKFISKFVTPFVNSYVYEKYLPNSMGVPGFPGQSCIITG